MAKPHDTAARSIAKKVKGRYILARSPDVKTRRVRVEVKTKASEIPQALLQLAGGSGPAYVALPTSEHPEALKRLSGCKTGLMNYRAKIIKPSSRK